MKLTTNKDVRVIDGQFEVRDGEGEPLKIVGYALKFDRPSEDLGFIETIDRSALDNTDMEDVVALLNHDTNYVLGRTGNNLDLEVDEIGLRFTLKPTNTSYTRDLIENMQSGLLSKCSFAFSVESDDWEEKDGTLQRNITGIRKLYDVSIVTTPAYSDTEAVLSARSKESLEEAKRVDYSDEIEVMKMRLEL